MGQVCYKFPKFYKLDNVELNFHAIFIKGPSFYSFSGVIQNPFVSVWYYHMPFSVMLNYKLPTTRIPKLLRKVKNNIQNIMKSQQLQMDQKEMLNYIIKK